MRSFRVLLAVLIALALPAQSLADARMAAACCPTAASDTAEAMSPGHDCCDEHDTNSSGNHCDEGSGCHCGSQLALAIHGFQPATHELERYPAAFTPLPNSAPSAAHWRPPAPRTDLI